MSTWVPTFLSVSQEEKRMIVSISQDHDFIQLKEFMFKFDFEYKHIIENQMCKAIVTKDKTDYVIVFRFYVDTEYSENIPDSMPLLPLPVEIEVKYERDVHILELYVSRGYIAEMRLYNLTCNALNMDHFWNGKATMRK